MQSLSTPLLLTVLCSFQSLRVGEGHNPPFQVGLKEVKLETKLGSSDVLLCLYLRIHQWDNKWESIFYEANSNSILSNCSLTTPLWLPWPGPSRAVLRRGLWAVAGLRISQSLLPQPPCPGWSSCLGCAATPSPATLQGNNYTETRSPTAGEVPEPALCSSTQCSSP